eukprot:scaffold322262_cov24-Tisochrysis_lutea.AAC.1
MHAKHDNIHYGEVPCDHTWRAKPPPELNSSTTWTHLLCQQPLQELHLLQQQALPGKLPFQCKLYVTSHRLRVKGQRYVCVYAHVKGQRFPVSDITTTSFTLETADTCQSMPSNGQRGGAACRTSETGTGRALKAEQPYAAGIKKKSIHLSANASRPKHTCRHTQVHGHTHTHTCWPSLRSSGNQRGSSSVRVRTWFDSCSESRRGISAHPRNTAPALMSVCPLTSMPRALSAAV